MSELQALSNQFAEVVEQAGRFVVTVNARSRPSSGIHWRSGVIVTADHTIKREEDITVTLGDGRTIAATLVGRDSSIDLAILKIEDTDLPVAEISDTSSLKVGHLVLAVGRFGGSNLTAGMGIIGALDGPWRRWWGGSAADQFARLDLMPFIGFSGSPLLDASGRVLGINTPGPRRMVISILAPTANRAIDQLLEKGRISRGYLGLSMQAAPLLETLRNRHKLTNETGVIVVNIEAGGPADSSGVLLGDVLVAVEGHPAIDTGEVLGMLSPDRVGKTVNAQILRGGELLELAIAVGERPRRDD